MGRVEWLRWVVRHGNPRTRARNLRGFLAFELYSLWCGLNGYRVTHWLDQKPLPAGRYLLTRRRPPPGVRLLDRVFPFGKEAHAEYTPHTPENEEALRKAGRPVEVVEVAYRVAAGE